MACGEAHCTKEILSKKFCKIDLFDEGQDALDDARKNLGDEPKVGLLSRGRMQDYTFDSQYNLILCRYCVGYLKDDELVAFLKTAAKNLAGRADQRKRSASCESFILVQDQVCQSDKYCEEEKGQRVRSRLELESIFRAAKLRIHKTGEASKVHNDFLPVMIWALY